MQLRATFERRPRTRERTPRFSMQLALLAEDCVTCGALGEVRRRGLTLCRDCEHASRPHRSGDAYDDLGGGG